MNRSQYLRHRIFARHAHPVSAWTRLVTTPLVAAPFWTRRADVTAGVLVWFAINPIMTPAPAERRAFATRAILGEERWLARPALDAMSAINAVGAAVLGGSMFAAWHRRKVPTVLGVAATMALTLYGWRRYAELYDGDRNAA
ncbi:DUF6653 family protein [Nocardia fluminea]|uniref:Uncharacterized protein n=1 Tax=Nocardia fluminea TaxID=134984 RepID=A0A2N3VHS1_9NOCA|nr:DUF6653 family protein [Nocardia fluminea]PKV81163.1 hypothetical protein ATK86_5625 [Nocardia fluminea]